MRADPSDPFDAIVSGLHEAVAGRRDWADAWTGAVRWVGGRSSVFQLRPPDGTVELLDFPDMDAPMRQSYLEHYIHLDPYNVPPDRHWRNAHLAAEVVDQGQYRSSEFFNDFVLRASEPCLDFVGAARPLPDGTRLMLGLQHTRADTFGTAEKTRLDALLPHLQGLLAARTSLRRLGLEAALLRATIEASDTAMMLADAEGRVGLVNHAASRLPGIGHLVSVSTPRGTALAANGFGRQVLSIVAEAVRGGGGCETVLMDENGPVLLVRATAMPAPGRRPGHGDGCNDDAVLLELTGLGATGGGAGRLCRVFGMTRAEAEVAVALAAGDGVAEIADRRAVSVNTLRAQIRAILDKTRTRSLRDAVRLLARF